MGCLSLFCIKQDQCGQDGEAVVWGTTAVRGMQVCEHCLDHSRVCAVKLKCGERHAYVDYYSIRKVEGANKCAKGAGGLAFPSSQCNSVFAADETTAVRQAAGKIG